LIGTKMNDLDPRLKVV